MNHIRCDRGEIKGKVTRTDEGYVRGDAVVTRTGVFLYRNADGTTRRELRHPDDVFEAASIESMRMIPITDGHPPELVNSDNAKELTIGHVGENIKIDRNLILAPLTVTHSDGIVSVEKGRKELSLGYAVDLIREDGVYNGEPYDHRQTNIRYNHLALVDRARAGAVARLNLDGMAVQFDDDQQETTMVKVKLDGLEYEAAPEVARALEKANERADAAESEKTDAEKKRDAMQAKIDEYKEKIEDMQKEMDSIKGDSSDEKVKAAAKARVALITKAAKVVADASELDDLSDREVMEKAIAAKHDGIDLKEKSDDYVAARFDAVIESVPDYDPAAVARQNAAAAGKPGAQRGDAAERESMINAVRNMHKGAQK